MPVLTIPEPEIAARLGIDNPWWAAKPDLARSPWSFPRRVYYPAFKRLLARDINRAVILLGARRVGKTTMLLQLAGEAAHSSAFGPVLLAAMDTPTYGGLSIDRLLELFEHAHPHDAAKPRLVLLDEIQYLPDWERNLKTLVDRFPRTRFVASGSAGAALKRKSNESGAGRFTDFELPPLNFAEFIQFRGLSEALVVEQGEGDQRVIGARDLPALNRAFVDYLNFGGFPEVVFSRDARSALDQAVGKDIVEKVLLRDLPSLYGIDNIPELNRLFSTLAWHTGHEMNVEALAQSSGVAKKTVTKYLDYLEAAFLIFRVRRLDDTARHFVRQRAFKIYLTNPSIRAALFGPCADDGDAIGALAETAAFGQWLHSPDFRNLHYARWHKGEVDVVRLNPGTQRPSWAYDVKWSDHAADRPEELRSLVELARRADMKLVGASTRTVSRSLTIDGVQVRLFPLALQCYRLGRLLADETRLVRRFDAVVGAEA